MAELVTLRTLSQEKWINILFEHITILFNYYFHTNFTYFFSFFSVFCCIWLRSGN